MIDLLALEPLLLDADPIGGEVPADFAACLNERGLYSTNQFVLRLNPRIHALVDAASPGLYAEGDLTEETLQAYSTVFRLAKVTPISGISASKNDPLSLRL